MRIHTATNAYPIISTKQAKFEINLTVLVPCFFVYVFNVFSYIKDIKDFKEEKADIFFVTDAMCLHCGSQRQTGILHVFHSEGQMKKQVQKKKHST